MKISFVSPCAIVNSSVPSVAKKKLFPPAEGSRLQVLARIVHDLPNHFLCDPCSVLHKFDGPEWFAKTSWLEGPSRLPCVYQYEWYRDGIVSQVSNILLWDRRRIYSDKLRLVMRWLYYGAQYGLGTESLYHTQVREYPESITLFSIEARSHLEQKGLCLRIQDILIVDNRRMDLFVPKHLQSPLHLSPPHFFWICEHLSHREFLDIVQSMLSVYIPKKSMPPSRGNFDKCNTDFDLQLKEVGHKIALILTKWIILGPGPEPNDADWGNRARKSILKEPDFQAIDITLSPRVSFETASCDNSIEALRSRNLSYLHKRRYRKLMTEEIGYYNEVWTLPQKGAEMLS